MTTITPLVSEVHEFNRFYARAIGLVQPEPASPTEAGVPTEAGLLAGLDIDQTSAAEALLAPLGQAQRKELVDAMAHIRNALGEKPQSPSFVLRAPGPGDLGWVIERHGYRYAHEQQWDATVEATVARIVTDFAESSESRQAAWIAELDGERVGSVFCVAADQEATAQLRLLLVEPSARGLGVGTQLVEECLRFAKQSGYTDVMLWTLNVCVAARRIYARSGFHLDKHEHSHHFGHDLVDEFWSRSL
ncbi:GNAT family N-acetyltransferase [Rhodococcus marinonascens]|uniref:GNAT family N-acetyltransferase n=1 Tax=Rhodococcus marinonascens TaxID=38311 RepID=UPI00093426DD|nr:GNAT family N-acetyltransferase [Rhodococcus marinonascens]